MKHLTLILLGIALVVLSAAPALSATESLVSLYIDIWREARETWIPRIIPYVLGLLFTTSSIAFAIGCKDLALSGGGIQLEGVIALFVRFALLTGMMSWFLSSPDYLVMIPNSLERLGSHISGKTITLGTLMTSFNELIAPIMSYYQGINWVTSPALSIVCIVLMFFIFCLCTLFLATVLLVKLETVFILTGGMFTAAFFVIGYFRDIFMGYIKALAMNGLKLMLLTLCLGLMTKLMEGWGAELKAALANDSGIYDTAIPMAFGLMAFYIVIKSVPQYAVAILAGHASADGSFAVAAASHVWNASRKVSNAALNSAATVHNAAQSYSNTFQSVRNSGGSKAKARGKGAIEALKTIALSPLGNRINRGGANQSGNNAGAANSNGVKADAVNTNEVKPGGAFDPYKVSDSHDKEMEGRK